MPKVIFEFDAYEDSADIKEVVQRKDVLIFLDDFEDILRKYWKYYNDEAWKDKTPFDAIEKIREEYYKIKSERGVSDDQ